MEGWGRCAGAGLTAVPCCGLCLPRLRKARIHAIRVRVVGRCCNRLRNCAHSPLRRMAMLEMRREAAGSASAVSNIGSNRSLEVLTPRLIIRYCTESYFGAACGFMPRLRRNLSLAG